MRSLINHYLRFLFSNKFNIFFALLLFSLVVARPVVAFNSPDDTYQFQFDQAVYHTDEMNLQSFVHEVIKAIQASGITAIIGCIDCPGAKTQIPATSPGSGLLWTLAYAIDTVYKNPPASGVYYLADIGTKLGIVDPAFAQYPNVGRYGIGFSKMAILLPLWKAFRDVAYVLFALVFVITGFAIMLKFKIDARTVITIESALPKIIVGIILVTFSYAIVGFAIDIMLVVNNLVIFTFQGLPGMGTFMGFSKPVTSDIQSFWAIIQAGLPPVLINTIIFLIIILVAGSSGVGLVISAGGIILFVIYLIILVIAFFKLLATLIKAYASIVLALIFAPFQIAFGSLPGSSSVNGWFKNLFSNLAVLPTVTAMAYIAGYITIAALNAIVGGLMNNIVDLFNGGVTNTQAQNIAAIQSGIALADFGTLIVMFTISNAILLMTPKAAEMIQGAITGKQIGMGLAIGAAIAPIMPAVNWGKGMAKDVGRGAFAGATGLSSDTAIERGGEMVTNVKRRLAERRGGPPPDPNAIPQ